MIISTVWSNEDGAFKRFKYLQKATVLSGGGRMQTQVAEPELSTDHSS